MAKPNASLVDGLNKNAGLRALWDHQAHSQPASTFAVAAKATYIGSALLSNVPPEQQREHAMHTAMELASANSNEKAAKVLVVVSTHATGAIARHFNGKKEMKKKVAEPQNTVSEYGIVVKNEMDEVHDVLVDETHPHFLAYTTHNSMLSENRQLHVFAMKR